MRILLISGSFVADSAADIKNITGSIFNDENVRTLVDKDHVIVENNGKYVVGEFGYDLAKDSETVTVIKAPAGAKIDNVPVGVTVVNNSVYINGIEVKAGTEYTVPSARLSASTTAVAASTMLYAKYLLLEGKDG